MKNKVATLQVNKTSDKLLSLILKVSFAFFGAGLISDLLFYIHSGNHTLSWLNFASMLIGAAAFFLYMAHVIKADASLLVLLSVIVINLCVSMIYMAYHFVPSNRFAISVAMAIVMIPVLLAQMASRHYFALFFAIACLGCYLFVALKLGETVMLWAFPLYVMTLLGTAIAQWAILKVTLRLERERAEAEKEKNDIVHYLELDPEKVALLQRGKLNRKEIDALMAGLTEKVQKRILRYAHTVAHEEAEISAALKKHHPSLTAGELELCRLIVEGNSVTEISVMRGVGISTVTSMRSRLRKKFRLTDGESLKSYLDSAVHNML